VLAKVAARVFIARGAVADVLDRIDANKSGLVAIAPEPQRFDGGADSARFATVLVNDNFGFFIRSVEVRLDEVHFGLNGSKGLLRAALQNESKSKFCKIGNAGYV